MHLIVKLLGYEIRFIYSLTFWSSLKPSFGILHLVLPKNVSSKNLTLYTHLLFLILFKVLSG